MLQQNNKQEIYNSLNFELLQEGNALKNKIENIIADFKKKLSEHANSKNIHICPVIKEGEYDLPTITWMDTVNKVAIPSELINATNRFAFDAAPWLKQLVVTTEKCLAEVRAEVRFLLNVIKKVQYWEQMEEAN